MIKYCPLVANIMNNEMEMNGIFKSSSFKYKFVLRQLKEYVG